MKKNIPPTHNHTHSLFFALFTSLVGLLFGLPASLAQVPEPVNSYSGAIRYSMNDNPRPTFNQEYYNTIGTRPTFAPGSPFIGSNGVRASSGNLTFRPTWSSNSIGQNRNVLFLGGWKEYSTAFFVLSFDPGVEGYLDGVFFSEAAYGGQGGFVVNIWKDRQLVYGSDFQDTHKNYAGPWATHAYIFGLNGPDERFKLDGATFVMAIQYSTGRPLGKPTFYHGDYWGIDNVGFSFAKYE